MKKYLITIAISILFISTSYAKTPMYSTEVDQGLAKMFNKSGLVDGIYWSGGQITRFSDIGGGSGNASYPINLAGTETTGILPQTQGGWGTDTVGTIGVVAGRIGIGTTTPSTKLHVIGTITATNGFSGSGAGLTDLVKQVSGTSTDQLATNLNIAGVGTDSSTMRINGVDISPTEKSYNDGLTGNIQAQLNAGLNTATSSASLAALITDETGTGSAVFAESPTINNPTLTGNVTMPGNETHTGSKTVTTGNGYDQTYTVQGAGTFTVTGSGSTKINTTGGISMGTTTFSSRYNKNKYFYVSDNTGTATYTLTGTTTQTVMATIPVPAGFMGTNGTFRVTSIVETGTNTGSTKTIRCRFGTGTTVNDTTQLGTEQVLSATNLSGASSFVFCNDGTTSSQMSYARSGYELGYNQVLGSSAVNTANATNILIVGLLGAAGDTMSLRKYWVEYNE